MQPRSMQIVLIGSGHLARALYRGWQRAHGKDRRIQVLARSRRLFDELWTPEEQAAISFDSHIVSEGDIVVLTVKPKDMTEALATVSRHLRPEALVLSPVAGYSLRSIRQRLPHAGLVRFMPNICAAIGASITLLSTDGLTSAQKVIVESLVSELGPIMEVEEELINPMTALLGSGPAYVYVFMQAIIEAGRRLGVDPDLARLLSAQMIEGAARLAQHDQSTDLDGLIRQVVSPGGTTEAMLTALDQAAWSESLTDALLKAGERAVELGRYSA